ncbi:MAG: alpha/beta hydrolase, partial [Promethearchaeota archaeon]
MTPPYVHSPMDRSKPGDENPIPPSKKSMKFEKQKQKQKQKLEERKEQEKREEQEKIKKRKEEYEKENEKEQEKWEEGEEEDEVTRDELVAYGRNINPFLEQMRARARTRTEISEYITSDGCPLFYRYWISTLQKSEKPPEKIIICIHGLHSHGEKFVLLADYLAKKPWRVFAIDLRGHGLSYNETHKRGDIEDFSLWIQDGLEFIAYLQKKYPKTPVYLVAESMGAALAVLF